jgi:uncharacterized paraquat-inducible protein A
MFCRKCGRPNADDGLKCSSCGEDLHPIAPKRIDNNLALAIVVTVICCLPFGILGIVYAAQVNAKAQAGDISGAEESARKARMWSLWGVGLGLVVYAGYALLAIAGEMGKLPQ